MINIEILTDAEKFTGAILRQTGSRGKGTESVKVFESYDNLIQGVVEAIENIAVISLKDEGLKIPPNTMKTYIFKGLINKHETVINIEAKNLSEAYLVLDLMSAGHFKLTESQEI